MDRMFFFNNMCCRAHLKTVNGFHNSLLGYGCLKIDCSKCKLNSHDLIIPWVQTLSAHGLLFASVVCWLFKNDQPKNPDQMLRTSLCLLFKAALYSLAKTTSEGILISGIHVHSASTSEEITSQ